MANKHESESLTGQFERYAKAKNPTDRKRIWESIKLAYNDYPKGSFEIRFEDGFHHIVDFAGCVTPLEILNRYYDLLSSWKDAGLSRKAKDLGLNLEAP